MKLGIFVMLTAMILLSFPGLSLAKKILVIESYHSEYPWDASYKKGLETILGKEHTLRYFQMDTKRVQKSEYEKMAELAWQEYEKNRPDLVILGDDNALKYLGPKFYRTETPVVYLGINANPRAYHADRKKNVTGVLERPLLKRSIAYLKEIIKPDLQKILVLFDSGTTAKSLFDEQFKGQTSLMLGKIRVDLRLMQKFADWQQAVENAEKAGYGAVIVGLYHTLVDADGNHVAATKALQWTDANSSVPLFGFWDFSVGSEKTIGGLVLFGQAQGESAGKIAQRILQGESPGRISPTTAEKGRLLFSRSQLKKWGLSLPPEITAKTDFIE